MSGLSYHTRRILDKDAFLSRFKHVVKTKKQNGGIENYLAYCPAHDTHHRSLVIGVCSDGRYLVHCYAGCSGADIMNAVGLSIGDLYPDGGMNDSIRPVVRPAESIINTTILDIATTTRKSGGRLSRADLAREREAWLASKKDASWPKGGSHE